MKRHLAWDLTTAPPVGSAPPFPVLPLTAASPHALGEAFLDAYRGTVDDEGETLDDAVAEVQRVMDGVYGPVWPEPSGIMAPGGVVAAALFVTRSPSGPFIPYVVTRKAYMGRGCAAALLQRAGARLRAAGETRVHLYVTAGNTPAERLYARLGWAEPPK